MTVNGLGFLKPDRKFFEGAIGANYAVEVPPYIYRELGYNGLNDFGILYACSPPT